MFNHTLEGGEGGGGRGVQGGVPPLLLRCTAVLIHAWNMGLLWGEGYHNHPPRTAETGQRTFSMGSSSGWREITTPSPRRTAADCAPKPILHFFSHHERGPVPPPPRRQPPPRGAERSLSPGSGHGRASSEIT